MVIIWTLTSWNSLHSLTKDPMRADFTLLRKERPNARHWGWGWGRTQGKCFKSQINEELPRKFH